VSADHRPEGRIVLYQADGRGGRIRVLLEGETVWLTQALIAELFQTTPQNITMHLAAIYAEGELAEPATCKAYLQVRTEGRRQVERAPKRSQANGRAGWGQTGAPLLDGTERGLSA
jgi:hypothetical protein